MEQVLGLDRALFSVPWLQPDPSEVLQALNLEEIASFHDGIPAGTIARTGTALGAPAQVPDLIGVQSRKYLDRTGLQRHRSIADLMRYAALNTGLSDLTRYRDSDPEPNPSGVKRYSDEQLYAVALFVYSLQPPPNPNQVDALSIRGQKVFDREGCGGCHAPPLYTNNRLVPVGGYVAPEDHVKTYDVLNADIGTDPTLALRTRRATGYYKVPSLKGVWYRGPFEHNGSVARLEDWFDPARLRDGYVPTGYKGYGVKTRAVRGHEFGLKLTAEDKTALIAFLRTL